MLDAAPLIEVRISLDEPSDTMIFGAEVNPIADGIVVDHVERYDTVRLLIFTAVVADAVAVDSYHASMNPLDHFR